MAPGIVAAEVGFNLDNNSRRLSAAHSRHELFAQQGTRQRAGFLREKIAAVP
jgi:hypothetical protein